MPNLAKIKAALKGMHDIDLNVGRNVGKNVNALTDAQIEEAIKKRFPNANITSHKVVPAQPTSKFGPFEPTSQVSIQSPGISLQEALTGLSADLQQGAIPGINKTTKEAVLAGPNAKDWGGEFSKQHFVRPGEETAYGNLQEQFKSQFEPGYYHGSPSNEIKAFDPSKSDKDLLSTPQATFVTKEPAFAESFLPESAHEIVEGSGRYYPFRIGSTIYPVSINKGKHFDFGTPEGQRLAKEFIKEKLIPEYGREKAARWLNSAQDELNNWKAVEHPDFLKHLQDTGHDTFSVTEGGVKNVGVFKPENIRGKFAEFDPTQAANPDFMKAAGGPIVKKALEFAKSVPFVHYSHSPNVARLEPSLYGTGIKGAEAGRLNAAPDIKPRSYFYPEGPNVHPEPGLGPHKYQGVSEASYPLHEDPAGFRSQARAQAKDPYLASVGVDQINQDMYLNSLERAIKNAGYSGYHTPEAGIVFNPTAVTKAE